MTMRQGRIWMHTLIAAPSSTKNKGGNRDPEMRQANKGNQGPPATCHHLQALEPFLEVGLHLIGAMF